MVVLVGGCSRSDGGGRGAICCGVVSTQLLHKG
jgi:hypothetical protein